VKKVRLGRYNEGRVAPTALVSGSIPVPGVVLGVPAGHKSVAIAELQV
jgi:hypothetical protein